MYVILMMILQLVILFGLCQLGSVGMMVYYTLMSHVCSKDCKLCMLLLSMFNILISFTFIWYAQRNLLTKS